MTRTKRRSREACKLKHVHGGVSRTRERSKSTALCLKGWERCPLPKGPQQQARGRWGPHSTAGSRSPDAGQRAFVWRQHHLVSNWWRRGRLCWTVHRNTWRSLRWSTGHRRSPPRGLQRLGAFLVGVPRLTLAWEKVW